MKYKTDRPFSQEELKQMDVIHDPNPSLFSDQNDKSYVLKDFINDSERDKLSLFFSKNFDKIGLNINDHVLHITYPMLIKEIDEIIRPKIYEHFGDDVIFYSDVAVDDPMSVGDQFFKSVKPYGLHTDSVTHINGYRPYKDIIIPINLTPEQLSSVNFSLSYRDANKPELYQVECSSIQEVSDDILVKRNYFRQKLVSLIYEILPSLSKSVLREDTLNEASTKVKSLIEMLSSESDELIVNLKTDLEGQVLEALDSVMAFNKWGKDYLPSLLQAHELQQCNNFKDPGVQSYGGKLFNTIRDKADSIFCDLPPPQPASYKSYSGMSSRGAAPTTMSVFNNSSGPCFDGNCDVLMFDNSLKKVKDIRKNDVVKTPHGFTKVICVTKTICKNSKSPMVTITDSGLVVSPYHPIRISNIWKFPIDCGEMKTHNCSAIYNFVLEDSHIMIINGIECCTLGHHFQNNSVIRHSYYGTNAVIDDLKKSQTWEYGIVIINPENIKRDEFTQMVNKIILN